MGLGSNMGDSAQQIWNALDLVSQAGIEVLAVSALYKTAPWGNHDQPDFINAAAKIGFGNHPTLILEQFLAIERKLGRIRAEKWGPRAIDLDLLLVGDLRLEEESLTLPHPFLEERLFVLFPLADVAPDLILPFSGLPIQDRIAQFSREELDTIQKLG